MPTGWEAQRVNRSCARILRSVLGSWLLLVENEGVDHSAYYNGVHVGHIEASISYSLLRRGGALGFAGMAGVFIQLRPKLLKLLNR